jgi:hypothetical protein
VTGLYMHLSDSRTAGLLVEEAAGDLEMECHCHLKALAAEVAVLRHRIAGTEMAWEIARTVMSPLRRTWR